MSLDAHRHPRRRGRRTARPHAWLALRLRRRLLHPALERGAGEGGRIRRAAAGERKASRVHRCARPSRRRGRRLRHRMDHPRALPHRPLLPAGHRCTRPRAHDGMAVRFPRGRRARRPLRRARQRARGRPPGGGPPPTPPTAVPGCSPPSGRAGPWPSTAARDGRRPPTPPPTATASPSSSARTTRLGPVSSLPSRPPSPRFPARCAGGSRATSADAWLCSRVTRAPVAQRGERPRSGRVMSSCALRRKHGVGFLTVQKAVTSAWPEPRKKLPPRVTRLDPYKPLIDVAAGRPGCAAQAAAHGEVHGYVADQREEIRVRAGRGVVDAGRSPAPGRPRP